MFYVLSVEVLWGEIPKNEQNLSLSSTVAKRDRKLGIIIKLQNKDDLLFPLTLFQSFIRLRWRMRTSCICLLSQEESGGFINVLLMKHLVVLVVVLSSTCCQV